MQAVHFFFFFSKEWPVGTRLEGLAAPLSSSHELLPSYTKHGSPFHPDENKREQLGTRLWSCCKNQYTIARNSHGRKLSRIGENFCGKTFADCSVVSPKDATHTNFDRENSQMDTKPQNSQKFSPPKVSHYTVICEQTLSERVDLEAKIILIEKKNLVLIYIIHDKW